MLQLSLRQIKILDHLLHNEVSHIDDLLAYAQISNRTLQSEIISINQELAHCRMNIVINSNRNRGYSAEPNDDNRTVYETLKHQCSAYLNYEGTMRYGDNPRIAMIIRKMLCAKDYIRGDDLVDELNISMATLTNDLRYVRGILEEYGIKVNSTPYYGMKIEATPYQVRSCLIDFCDIYDIYAETFYFEPKALDQYHIDQTKLKDIRKQLTTCLREENITLKEQSFLHMYFYILIKTSGYDLYPINEQGVRYGDDKFRTCAEKIINTFHIEKEELDYIKVLLIAGSENLSKSYIEQSIVYDKVVKILNEILMEVNQIAHLDLGRKEHILMILQNFIFDFLLMKKYQIYQKNNRMGIHNTVKDIPVSNTLSIQILEILKRLTNYEYEISDVLSLTMQLFNAIFLVPNEYEMVRVAFLGSFSADTGTSVAYRLSTSSRHNVHKDFYSFYQIDDIDFHKYDCVFVINSNGLRLTNCPSEVFYVDYFNHYEETNYTFFEQVLAKHRIENFLLYKTDNKVHIKIDNQGEDYMDKILSSLGTYGYDNQDGKQILDYLIDKNMRFHQINPFVICLLWKEELERTLFIYELEKPIVKHGFTLSEIQIVVMDPNDNILAIKQADSYVRRMQRRCAL